MQKRYLYKQFVVLFLGAVLFVPANVFAQEARGWNWFRSNSAARSAINALPEEASMQLPVPVLFTVSVADITPNFGDLRGGGTRLHEGLDMLAPKGTPIISPTQAVVTRIGTGSSAGVYVRTANPGGETFVYMHLDAVADNINEGDILNAGQIIGYVGDTGNAVGGPDHLHFEIRKNGATDPFARITHSVSLVEAMQFVANELTAVKNPAARAAWYAEHIENELRTAQQQGIALHPLLARALGTNTSQAAIQNDMPSVLPTGVSFGDSGARVLQLQQFLIAHAVGAAGARLRAAGATGYFGSITQAALDAYTATHGISSVAVQQGAAYNTVPALAFTRNLATGDVGEDVRALQQFLNNNGFIVSQTGAGSQGFESDYFGALTKQALAAYQEAHGITPAAGYFGPITRAYIFTSRAQ